MPPCCHWNVTARSHGATVVGWTTIPTSRPTTVLWRGDGFGPKGNVAEAARLLTFHEAILWPAPQTLQANDMLAGLVYLERARAEEALGHREVAREYYDQFLRRYDLPVAAHRHHVEDAPLAVVRLRGDPAVAARHNSKIAHASRANAP